MRITLCFVTLILASLSASIAFAAPDLQVSESKFDFGEIFQGDVCLGG